MAAIKKLLAIFIVGASFVCCECSFVNALPKCRASDYECQKNVMQSYLRNMGKTGIQELDSISIDPLDVRGLNIPVYDLVDINLTEGSAKGVKDCLISKYNLNFNLGKIFVEAYCDIVATGKYTVTSYNPLIKIFLGTEALHGEGSGQVNIEKLKVTADLPFDLVERNNNVYVNSFPGYGNITLDVLGKVEFHANKNIENDPSSDILIRVLNENWKLVMDFVFRIAKDIGTNYIYSFNTKFFNNVPLKSFIIEDFFSPSIYG